MESRFAIWAAPIYFRRHFTFRKRQSENKVNGMRRVKPAGFVVVIVFWLGAASTVGPMCEQSPIAFGHARR